MAQCYQNRVRLRTSFTTALPALRDAGRPPAGPPPQRYWDPSLAGDESSTLEQEQCVIKGEHFFVRGRLVIPVTGAAPGTEFDWGVWVSLSRGNFTRAQVLSWPKPSTTLFSEGSRGAFWFSAGHGKAPDPGQVPVETTTAPAARSSVTWLRLARMIAACCAGRRPASRRMRMCSSYRSLRSGGLRRPLDFRGRGL